VAALISSRNTPEWNGSTRIHYGLTPVEANTSIFVGSMVALNSNRRAVKAQALGAAPLDKLQIIGICEYVYAGGILPPGIDALNQTGNGSLYPSATATLGTAGAISIGIVSGIFGLDVDSTIIDTTRNGELCFASDDHTVTMGALVANTTSIVTPAAAPFVNVLLPNIVRGTFNAYSATGAGGTHYAEGVDFAVNYETGLFTALAGGALTAGTVTVFITYFHSTAPVAGRIYSYEQGMAWVHLGAQSSIP